MLPCFQRDMLNEDLEVLEGGWGFAARIFLGRKVLIFCISSIFAEYSPVSSKIL